MERKIKEKKTLFNIYKNRGLTVIKFDNTEIIINLIAVKSPNFLIDAFR